MTKAVSTSQLYDGWLKLLKVRILLPDSDEIDLHVVKVPRGAAVLPYDPSRGCVLVVSQPRAAIALAGLADFLEPISGAVEHERPDECAIREALEEAGVRLSALELLGDFWSSTSHSNEQLSYFLAPYSRDDIVSPGGGAAAEREHVSVHELPLGDLWRSFEDGQVQDAKLVLLLMGLRLRVPALFSA